MIKRKEDTPQRVANRKYEEKNKNKRKQKYPENHLHPCFRIFILHMIPLLP